MKYPLTEGIGNPDLLVGREKEFAEFDEWIHGIPRQISKSRVILARRKSEKTVFVQRIFNRLWNENGEVVPFFISMPETKIWYTDFAVGYYCKFASQYISFLERDESLADMPMTLDQLNPVNPGNPPIIPVQTICKGFRIFLALRFKKRCLG